MCGLFISWRKAERRRGGRDGEVREVVRGSVEDGRENRTNIRGEREGAGVLKQQACQGLWSWLAVIY